MMYRAALGYFIKMGTYDVIRIEIGERWGIRKRTNPPLACPFISSQFISISL
jgi:hypothetical protein